MRRDDRYDEMREAGDLRPTDVARDTATAIPVTIGRRTNRDEWRAVRQQLPDEYAALYEVCAEP